MKICQGSRLGRKAERDLAIPRQSPYPLGMVDRLKSDGFYNPQMARESLAQSIHTSQEGIKLLEKAIEEKKK